jgi:hypothetical protein
MTNEKIVKTNARGAMRHSCSPERRSHRWEKQTNICATEAQSRQRPEASLEPDPIADYCILQCALDSTLHPWLRHELKLLHDVGASRLNKTIFGKTNPRCALATERQVFGENTDTTVGGL